MGITADLIAIRLDSGDHLLHNMECSYDVLDPLMSGTTKHEIRLAELVDSPKALKCGVVYNHDFFGE